MVKNLKTLCHYAEARGKTICLEPLNRFETDFINTCEQGLEMIEDRGSPALKLHLDTFHMNIEEKDRPPPSAKQAGTSAIFTPAAAIAARRETIISTGAASRRRCVKSATKTTW